MNKQYFTIIILTGLVLTGFALSVQPIFAQEQRIMTIVPPSVSVSLNPGDRTEGTLKMINDSDSALTFNVNAQDFVVTDTNGTPDLLPENTLGKKYSAAAWIGVSPSIFTVEPHQKQVLTYYIQVPTTARPGGHYAAIVYNPTDLLAAGQTGAAVQTHIGSLFSIAIKGDINELAQVTLFAAKQFQEYGPVTIVTQIKNFGDLHTKPQGAIVITDMVGRTIASLPLEGHNIFPEAARDYTNVLKTHWLLGRFKATLIASYGVNNNLPITATLYFWVFPWKVAIIVTLIILAIILGLLLWKRKKDGKEIADGTDLETPII